MEPGLLGKRRSGQPDVWREQQFADNVEDLKCKIQRIYYQPVPCNRVLQDEEMKQVIRSVKKQNADAQPSPGCELENQSSTSFLSCKINVLPSYTKGPSWPGSALR